MAARSLDVKVLHFGSGKNRQIADKTCRGRSHSTIKPSNDDFITRSNKMVWLGAVSSAPCSGSLDGKWIVLTAYEINAETWPLSWQYFDSPCVLSSHHDSPVSFLTWQERKNLCVSVYFPVLQDCNISAAYIWAIEGGNIASAHERNVGDGRPTAATVRKGHASSVDALHFHVLSPAGGCYACVGVLFVGVCAPVRVFTVDVVAPGCMETDDLI